MNKFQIDSKSLLLFSILVFILFLLAPVAVFAHPGNTAADGCHFCRTNCSYWGESWGARHCHDNYLPEYEYDSYLPEYNYDYELPSFNLPKTPIRTIETIYIYEEIPFLKSTINDDNIEFGKTVITQNGINGQKRAEYMVFYADGKETDRYFIESTITRHPKNEVTAIGTKIAETITPSDDWSNKAGENTSVMGTNAEESDYWMVILTLLILISFSYHAIHDFLSIKKQNKRNRG